MAEPLKFFKLGKYYDQIYVVERDPQMLVRIRIIWKTSWTQSAEPAPPEFPG